MKGNECETSEMLLRRFKKKKIIVINCGCVYKNLKLAFFALVTL